MTSGNKRSNPPPVLSSLFAEKRNRVSDAFSFLSDIGNKKEELKSGNNSDAKHATSDTVFSDLDNAGNNLAREERQQMDTFNRDMKLCHQRHQADAMALLSNTATNTMFIKDYIVVECICEGVVVLRGGDTYVIVNLRGMNKHNKDLDIGRTLNVEYMRGEIERGRGIEFIGRQLEDNVYGTRTFRFV